MITDRKIIRARSELLLQQPFFGSLCLRLETVEDSSCPGAWTDGKTFAYNPHYVGTLSKNQLKGLLAHTVMHPACQHHIRRKGRDRRIWNMACDYAINWILLDAGFELPPGYLDDDKYRGRAAEDIFSELTGELDRQGNPESGVQQDGPKRIEVEDENGPGQDGDLEENNKDNQEQAGNDQDNNSDSEARDYQDMEESRDRTEQDNYADPGGTGEVRDAPEADSGGGNGSNETDRNWLQALAQAANQARDTGDLPGGILRLVEELLYPLVDWRELLERFISDRARNDYSWTPPSRRHLHMNIYLPSLSTQQLPEVVLAIDSSGSISPRELDQFGAELSGILEAYDTTVRVLWCDMAITSEQEFSRADLPLELRPEGGGGTDFRPVFARLENHYPAPACLIYLSDMECAKFPQNEPDYPVLWARIGNGGRIPPFGHMLDICPV